MKEKRIPVFRRGHIESSRGKRRSRTARRCLVNFVMFLSHLIICTTVYSYRISTTISYFCRRPCTSSSALYRHDDVASAVDATLYHRGPGVSGGGSSSLEQSVDCDENRQLAAAVSPRDKSTPLSPVVFGPNESCCRALPTVG